jgi:flagellar protein FliO/FliZ
MIDLALTMRFAAALAIVLGLIAILTWLAKRYFAGGAFGRNGKTRRRVAVVEVTPIDAKSRLVLVRRDSAEHLLLLGPTGAVVVESGVNAPGDFASTLAPLPALQTSQPEPQSAS